MPVWAGWDNGFVLLWVRQDYKRRRHGSTATEVRCHARGFAQVKSRRRLHARKRRRDGDLAICPCLYPCPYLSLSPCLCPYPCLYPCRPCPSPSPCPCPC